MSKLCAQEKREHKMELALVLQLALELSAILERS